MTETNNENFSNSLSSGTDRASYSTSVRPADNLFEYTNGPWINEYKLPDDKARFGSFDALSEKAEKDLRDIIEDPSSGAEKSKIIYNAFMDEQATEKAGFEPVKNDLAAVDSVQNKEELARVIGKLEPHGGPALFDFAVYPDPGNSTKNIVHIGQSGIGLPDEAYYREDRHEPIRKAYLKMVISFLTLSGYAADEDQARSMAERFLATETAIASHHWDVVTTRNEDKTYNPTTFGKLSGELADFNIELWIQGWQEEYDSYAGAKLNPVNMREALENTIVHEPDFLTGLSGFWKEADLEDLKLWARIHIFIRWSSLLSKDFSDAVFEFFGKTLSGTVVQRDRWKRAISLTDNICGEDLGREYVKRFFPASSKERMEKMVANLIEAYRISISNSDWLGEETKEKALEKLDKFEPKIGYTNRWRDYSALILDPQAGIAENRRRACLYESGYQIGKAGKDVDKEEWLMTPQTVNAYYEPSMNVIVFPAAILQPPFFNPLADDAANYGGIGAVIGHEIGHGFDDQGSKYDGDGHLRDWWTEEDRKNFEQRTAKLIAQYDSYTPAQLVKKYAAEGRDDLPHVNGAFTIGENIGDLGGVNIALKAYALSLGGFDGSEASLKTALEKAPVLDGFTGLQRFFLSYSTIWRTVLRDELAERYLQIDPHSPAEFRANGIVSNVDAFYDAFGVTENDAMYIAPEDRVKIW